MRSGRQSFKPSSGDRSRMQQLPDSADDLPESVMVNLDSKDSDAFDIVEVEDQIDDADRGQPTSLDSSVADDDDDPDVGPRAQKRIKRLKFETHTERRAREAAERERDAAIVAARAKDDEIADLRKRMVNGTTALATSMKAEREARLTDATRRLAAAHEAGDSAAIAQATADIATATSEITNIVALLLLAIDPEKDADGLHTLNLGRLLKGEPGPRSCTPAGVMALLARHGVELAGKRAVVVGRSILVGQPMALMLQAANATVTVAHSRTQDLAAITRQADVLVVAAGKPLMLGAEHVKPGAVVVDVGIHRTESGLCGDVRFAEVEPIASAISPVPGGVGPMTVTLLLVNTVRANG